MTSMQGRIDTMSLDDAHPDSGYDGSPPEAGYDESITIAVLPVTTTQIVTKATDRLRSHRRQRGDGGPLVKHKTSRVDVEPHEVQDWIVKVTNRLPVSVAADRVHRIQLYSSFLQVHFPSTSAKASLVFRNSYLLAFADHVDIDSVPLLSHGTDHVNDRPL